MTTPWRKALRDFWQERTRSALVVLAIALGIAAFSTVLSTYAILVRELDQGYLATNPASAVLLLDEVDDALLAELPGRHGVARAEARRVVSGRIKAGPAEWRSLRLFVVPDYGRIRIGRLVPQEGAWPPAAGEILIERDAFQVARTRIGDSVLVQMGDGRQRTLRVAGSVHDVGQAQARMENVVYGYLTLDTLALLGERPYLDQLALEVAGDKLDASHIRSVVAEVQSWLEARGRSVRRVDIPTPGKHPHADIMGLLLVLQAGFGLFALALSGVLVVNLLTALLASQVRQIAVMKAVGGTRARIARIYLGQALLLGVAAVALAIPAGIWGGRVFCRSMAVFLNFDITSFAVPWWVYLLDGFVGVAVPLAAAAYPVAKGSAVSVREALCDFGVAGGGFGAGRLDRWLAGTGGARRPLLLSIRNGFRRRARLLMTLGTLSAAGLFYMSAHNIRGSLENTLDRLFASARYDLSVSLGTMQAQDALARAVARTPGVRRAEGWITTEGQLPAPEPAPSGKAANDAPSHAARGGGPHAGGAQSGDRINVVALPAGTDMVRPDIVEGRALREGDVDVVVVNSALAGRPGMKVGEPARVRIGPADVALEVVGLAREPFSPAVAYVPLAFFERRGHTGVANSLRLALDSKDPAAIAAVRAALDRNFEQEGVRAIGSVTSKERRYGFDQHMLMIYVFLVVMSGILAGVGGLGLTTTMSLNVLERRREMGILRAIGATPRVVGSIVVAEAAVIGLLSWALAALAAWPVGKLVGDLLVTRMFRTGLDFRFDAAAALVWLALSLALSVAASLAPAWRASRRPIREAIAYE